MKGIEPSRPAWEVGFLHLYCPISYVPTPKVDCGHLRASVARCPRRHASARDSITLGDGAGFYSSSRPNEWVSRAGMRMDPQTMLIVTQACVDRLAFLLLERGVVEEIRRLSSTRRQSENVASEPSRVSFR